VAAAVEMGSERAATPSANTQRKAGPTAEPTPPLQVVGADVVPTFDADAGEPAAGDGGNGLLLSVETASYLVFLLIIAGLLGLTGFVSLRRRRER
jgi:LPXTG-motif cell wall-anchored protein